MNFHYELRKSSCRKELKRRTGRSLDILEVRRHELTAACSPKWAPCRIRYYPGVGRTTGRALTQTMRRHRPGGAAHRLDGYAGGCTL